MLQLAVTVRDGALAIQRADGVAIEGACDTGDAFSATEMLAASLGSCVAASLLPLFHRHDIDPAALHVRVAHRDGTLASGLEVTVTLPRCDEDIQVRCRRAAESCPVKQALNIPLEFHWQTG